MCCAIPIYNEVNIFILSTTTMFVCLMSLLSSALLLYRAKFYKRLFTRTNYLQTKVKFVLDPRGNQRNVLYPNYYDE